MQSVRIVAVVFGALVHAQFAHGEAVSVTLTGRTKPLTGKISVGDVATVAGGDLITRRKIAELDLIGARDISVGRITKQQVAVRILLEGITGTEFSLSGPEAVMIRRLTVESVPEPKIEELPIEQIVLDFLRPHIAERLGVVSDEVEVQLSRPLSVASFDAYQDGMQLKHYLPTRISTERLSTRVGIHDGSRLLKTVSISLQIQTSQNVLVAARKIDSGATIASEDITEDVRLISVGEEGYSTPEDIIGRIARRAILPRQIIIKKDLKPSRPQRRQVVIRARDPVEIIANRKSLRIRISGAMALQSGSIGDSIRVKNPGSGTVLSAQVVDAGRVRIGL